MKFIIIYYYYYSEFCVVVEKLNSLVFQLDPHLITPGRQYISKWATVTWSTEVYLLATASNHHKVHQSPLRRIKALLPQSSFTLR